MPATAQRRISAKTGGTLLKKSQRTFLLKSSDHPLSRIRGGLKDPTLSEVIAAITELECCSNCVKEGSTCDKAVFIPNRVESKASDEDFQSYLKEMDVDCCYQCYFEKRLMNKCHFIREIWRLDVVRDAMSAEELEKMRELIGPWADLYLTGDGPFPEPSFEEATVPSQITATPQSELDGDIWLNEQLCLHSIEYGPDPPSPSSAFLGTYAGNQVDDSHVGTWSLAAGAAEVTSGSSEPPSAQPAEAKSFTEDLAEGLTW